MTIKELIDYVDRMKPNPYTTADKIVWLNEFERKLQTEVYLMHPDDVTYYGLDAERKMVGISFPDEHTMILPERITATRFANFTVSGLQTYAANNGKYMIGKVYNGKEVIIYGGKFAVVGEEGDSGEATLTIDHSEIELLLEPAFEHLYYLYLMAQMDFSNQEYDRYDNSSERFNTEYSAYKKWYTTHYPNRGCCC